MHNRTSIVLHHMMNECSRTKRIQPVFLNCLVCLPMQLLKPAQCSSKVSAATAHRCKRVAAAAETELLHMVLLALLLPLPVLQLLQCAHSMCPPRQADLVGCALLFLRLTHRPQTARAWATHQCAAAVPRRRLTRRLPMDVCWWQAGAPCAPC